MEVKNQQTRYCANPDCRQPFQAWPSQPRKFCSRACSWARNGRLDVQPSKMCAHCHVEFKPTSSHQTWCNTCRGGDRILARKLKRYDLSAPEWEAMVARFDGLCWICQERTADTVDHCHKTNVVRGALCRVCNMVLHYVERPGWWDTAVRYLDEGGGEDCDKETPGWKTPISL